MNPVNNINKLNKTHEQLQGMLFPAKKTRPAWGEKNK